MGNQPKSREKQGTYLNVGLSHYRVEVGIERLVPVMGSLGMAMT